MEHSERLENHLSVLYFFSYKTEFFPFRKNPKDLDPSYKMDLDLWGCFEREKNILSLNYTRPIYIFAALLEE